MCGEKKAQTAEPAIGAQELDDHIEHSAHLMELADALGNPQERDSWWQALRLAIETRDRLYGRQRHEAFEVALRARELDEGVDFFQAQARQDSMRRAA